MKTWKIVVPSILILCIAGGVIVWQQVADWRSEQQERYTNPYEKDGLRVSWDIGGATSSYPSMDVWVSHRGMKLKPDVLFSGLEDPELSFKDFDGDGAKDIVFEDRGVVKAVAFFPATDDKDPRFVTLRDDRTSE